MSVTFEAIKEGINEGSRKEREAYWQGVSENEAKSLWEAQTNAMLAPYLACRQTGIIDPNKREALILLQKILKGEKDTTLDQVEVSARSIYNTFIREGQGSVEFFVRRITERANKEERARNRQLIMKLALIYGKESANVALELIDSADNHSIIGTDLKTGKNITISQKERLQGLWIIGSNGTGKTSLIYTLIMSDIEAGLGVCLVEPHGDLTQAVLEAIPAHRLNDVILLDLSDCVDHPVGINPFECPRLTIRDMAKTASFVSHVFEKIWGAGTDTPRLLQNLRAVTRTLIENPGTTFAEIPLLYSNATVRAKMLSNLSNPSIISYWEEYERKPQRERGIYLESFLNKVGAFTDEPMIRNIFGQSKTTLDFRHIMDTGKILLVKLSPEYDEASKLVGATIIGKILLAAFSRADTPEHARRHFSLYCDEFQRYASSDMATLIAEARKMRILTHLAHQTLSQVDEANRTAAAAAGNLIVFRVSGEDGKTLAPSFDSTPQQIVIGFEPERSFVSDVLSHLVKRGHNDPRVVRFAQVYLKNLEDLVHKITQYDYWPVYGEWPIDLKIETRFIRQASQLLNESIYRCMVEKTANRQLSPLALYILSVAQHDSSETVFFPYINYYGILPPHYFQGFFKGKGVEVFGDPSFINKESDCFIESCRRKKKPAAIALVNMITELRYTMDTLAKQPILMDTGQLIPKFSNRTYSDQQAEVANSLTNQPNYQAKVKLLTGEYTIQTIKPTGGIEDSQKETRIRQIQQQTRQNYCKPRTEIEQEIRERQDRLKAVENKPNPTSTKATQPQRTRRHRADEIPPAWS